MTAPGLVVESTVAFLRAHEPFARMARGDLRLLAERVRLAYFPAGSTIVDPAAGRTRDLHIVQRGHVRGEHAEGAGEDRVLAPGECFPVAALAAGSVGARRFVATEDVFCLLLPEDDFAQLRERSPPFAEFCLRALASIVQQSLGQTRRAFNQRAAEQHTLLEPLAGLLRRAPVHCTGDTPLRAVLEALGREQVGTMAVVDAAGQPIGIFTLTDLLNRVVLPGVDLTAPVASVMTGDPGRLDERASAEEAIALMAQRGLHQLMVTREGRLTGVVSERDLFALQRVSMRGILQSIRGAGDEAALTQVGRRIDQLTDNLVAQGARAEPLTRTITALNDALTQRLFELLVPRHRLADLEWCWLSR